MHKMKPIITVAVPIYGTEKYLKKCLQSILAQTLKEIEIICVDDCSPDNSYLIVQKLQKTDPRLKLIRHKVNTGQGGARNTAIRAAQAEFVASVDSDDTIKPNMLEKLWQASDNGRFDIVCCGYTRVNEKGESLVSTKFQSKEVINDKETINIFSLMNPAIWNKLWRKSLYIENDIFFPHGIYYQDMATIPLLISKSKNIKFISDSLYNYLVREGSVTNTYSPKHIIDYFKVYGILYDNLERLGFLESYSKDLFEYVNEGMRFHSNNVIDSEMSDSDIDQYLRHLLMLKISFLESHSFLISKDRNDLLDLLKAAESIEDIVDSPLKTVDLNIGAELHILENKKTINEKAASSSSVDKQKKQLTKMQIVGSRLFGLVFRGFIQPKQRIKLKNTPELFFKDSKNQLTRIFGSLLKII